MNRKICNLVEYNFLLRVKIILISWFKMMSFHKSSVNRKGLGLRLQRGVVVSGELYRLTETVRDSKFKQGLVCFRLMFCLI